MPVAIPSTARALILDAYDIDHEVAVRSLHVEERPVPSPGPGQVLVRVEAAACNPSDIIFLTGSYVTPKELPTAPGWEGAGTVVAAGPGLFGRFLKGRRVAFGSLETEDGSWGEYCLTDAARCIPLAKDVSTEQAADLIVNPMTAVGMLAEARRGRHRAAMSYASASQRYIIKVLGAQFGLSTSAVEEFLGDERTYASINDFLKGDERVPKLLFFYQTRDMFTDDGEFIEASGARLHFRINYMAA